MYAPTLTWDLDAILPGGPVGQAFEAEYQGVKGALEAILVRAEALSADPHPAVLAGVLLDLERVGPRLDQLYTFAGCHAAADAVSELPVRAEARLAALGALSGRCWVPPRDRVVRMPEASFEALIAEPSIAHMRNMLLSDRKQGRLRLSDKEESLVAQLAQDGVIGWGSLYDVESGALEVKLDRGNGVETLSAGQAEQAMWAPDRAVRERAFHAVRAAWSTIDRRCATALSHITGTRLTLNDRRGLDELEEPLVQSRIARSTLEAIIAACREAQPLLSRYFQAKARAIGVPRLEWYDLGAPLGEELGGVSYELAQRTIVHQFDAFAPGMAGFAARALREQWIEVEDRPGKRAGGFCAEVPLLMQSRIFMTWADNDKSASTLAHELGHAFHNEVLFEAPVAQRRLPMTLAETASTFAEALVREASRAQAHSPAQRLRLLDGALQDASAFLCNIPARFDLERELYRLRREGPLEAAALREATTRIYGEWYAGQLASVDDLFWARKLHFYIPSIAFYNYPYTFGYLFANLVYAHYRPQGAAAEAGYRRLLRRTGDEEAEVIAREELGLDLGDVATWRKAMGGLADDVAAFEALVQ
ncbi:MAG: hypothetical protein FJ090_17565 [Deltaproteobacteria bacterium]|nr:hypothetical protein [Deltaproteobacteria bacterium]